MCRYSIVCIPTDAERSSDDLLMMETKNPNGRGTCRVHQFDVIYLQLAPVIHPSTDVQYVTNAQCTRSDIHIQKKIL